MLVHFCEAIISVMDLPPFLIITVGGFTLIILTFLKACIQYMNPDSSVDKERFVESLKAFLYVSFFWFALCLIFVLFLKFIKVVEPEEI